MYRGLYESTQRGGNRARQCADCGRHRRSLRLEYDKAPVARQAGIAHGVIGLGATDAHDPSRYRWLSNSTDPVLSSNGTRGLSSRACAWAAESSKPAAKSPSARMRRAGMRWSEPVPMPSPRYVAADSVITIRTSAPGERQRIRRCAHDCRHSLATFEARSLWLAAACLPSRSGIG